MSANVVPLEPKSKHGKRYGNDWVVTYNPATKRFSWTVTVYVKPQVFNGEAQSMKEAQQEVDKIMSKFK